MCQANSLPYYGDIVNIGMMTDEFENVVSQLVELLLRLGSAGCARCIAIFRRNQDVTAPARVSNMLNICLRRVLVITERKRRK